MEGDGSLILHHFEVIDGYCIAIKRMDSHSPNAEAAANDWTKGSVVCKKSLVEYGRSSVQPVIIYFNDHLEASL